VATRVEAIGDRVRDVIRTARRDGVPSVEAAVTVARERMAAVGGLRRFHVPNAR
jgi:hypothetical protein